MTDQICSSFFRASHSSFVMMKKSPPKHCGLIQNQLSACFNAISSEAFKYISVSTQFYCCTHTNIIFFFFLFTCLEQTPFRKGNTNSETSHPCSHPLIFPIKSVIQEEPPINHSSPFRKWEVTEYFSGRTKQLPALCGSVRAETENMGAGFQLPPPRKHTKNPNQ